VRITFDLRITTDLRDGTDAPEFAAQRRRTRAGEAGEKFARPVGKQSRETWSQRTDFPPRGKMPDVGFLRMGQFEEDLVAKLSELLQKRPWLGQPVQDRQAKGCVESLPKRGPLAEQRGPNWTSEQDDALMRMGFQHGPLDRGGAGIGLATGDHAPRRQLATLKTEPAEVGAHIQDRAGLFEIRSEDRPTFGPRPPTRANRQPG